MMVQAGDLFWVKLKAVGGKTSELEREVLKLQGLAGRGLYTWAFFQVFYNQIERSETKVLNVACEKKIYG